MLTGAHVRVPPTRTRTRGASAGDGAGSPGPVPPGQAERLLPVGRHRACGLDGGERGQGSFARHGGLRAGPGSAHHWRPGTGSPLGTGCPHPCCGSGQALGPVYPPSPVSPPGSHSGLTQALLRHGHGPAVPATGATSLSRVAAGQEHEWLPAGSCLALSRPPQAPDTPRRHL